jgi:signal transduction histidine kinase/CheY-like chemotaxis protein
MYPGRMTSRGSEVSDVEPRIIQTVFDRMRLGLAIELVGISSGLVLSIPSGIPLPLPIIGINAVVLAVAVTMLLLLRRGRIPDRHAHLAAAALWLLAPITTLSSLATTREPNLVFPFIIEMALASIMLLSQRMLIASTLSAFGVWLALELTLVDDPALLLHVGSVVGLTVSAWLIGRSVRRSMDQAILREREQAATAALLQRELEERLRLEKEREALRDQFVHAQRMDAVGTLAAGLAHDMNNIIAAISGVAQIAAEETAESSSQADFLAIAREATRAADLTRGLLAYARRGQYRRAVVGLETVIDEIEPLVVRMFANRVALERRGGTEAFIDADAAQVGQAIVNLCINGADAMETGGTLTLSTSVVRLADAEAARLELGAAGEYAAISVRDTGRGMDEDVKKRIFEPFFTTKEVGKGTGLGLAMVYGTVRGHGGGIDVTSAPGRGSTFTIYFPLAPRPEKSAAPARLSSPRAVASQLALVVDDEPMVRAVATRILRGMGLSVVGASDGAEALEVFAARGDEISVVVLDMSMPVMGGAEVFRELRKTSRVPVVIASGFASQTETQALLASGNACFLEKPFRVESLREQVQRMLGERSTL